MWMELRNDKYRYFERYHDPMTGKLRKISVTLDRKAAEIIGVVERLIREF